MTPQTRIPTPRNPRLRQALERSLQALRPPRELCRSCAERIRADARRAAEGPLRETRRTGQAHLEAAREAVAELVEGYGEEFKLAARAGLVDACQEHGVEIAEHEA